jgi:hypothetical protein
LSWVGFFGIVLKTRFLTRVLPPNIKRRCKMAINIEKLEANVVVAVGSVDGVCTTAAVLRRCVASPEADVVFTQAFTVDQVDVSTWGPSRRVLFVDLAVNNRDKSMTVGFLLRIKDAGHTVVGILDEHNSKDWYWACEQAGIPFEDLIIRPVTQRRALIDSSGAFLLSLLGDEVDEHTRELCEAADAGDKMDFTTHFGSMVNSSVKSKMADDSRRVHLARHLANQREPDQDIQQWMSEYEKILANHEEIVAARIEITEKVVCINTVGKDVDMTTLMGTLYKHPFLYDLVVVEGEFHSKSAGAKTRQIGLGCNFFPKIDLVTIIRDAGIEVSGFASKANIRPEDQAAAAVALLSFMRAVRVLRSLPRMYDHYCDACGMEICQCGEDESIVDMIDATNAGGFPFEYFLGIAKQMKLSLVLRNPQGKAVAYSPNPDRINLFIRGDFQGRHRRFENRTGDPESGFAEADIVEKQS